MRQYVLLVLLALLEIPQLACANTGESYSEKYFSLQNSGCIDTACVDSMFLWLYYLQSKDAPMGDSISNLFLQYANSKPNDYLKAKAYLLQAVVANNHGESIEAIPFALTAIKYFNGQPSIDNCFAYQNLSQAYNNAGNYKLARESNKKALAIAEALQNEVLISNSYNSIGISYNQDKQYKEAIPWFRRVIALSEKTGKPSAVGYQNMGLCFRQLGQYDSALIYGKKSLVIAEQQGNKYNIAYSFSELGATFIESKMYDTAIVYLRQSAAIYEARRENFNLVYVYMYLGNCYAAKRDKQTAQNYYHKALALNKYNNNLKQRYEIYYQTGKMYSDIKEFDSAYIYNLKYALLQDSVLRAKSELSAAATVASYQLGEKEKNIQLLRQKNDINSMAIVIVVVLFLLLVVLALWWLNHIRFKQKQTELQNFQTLQQERERIARDLHDNVGGQLSYIIYSLDGINDEDETKRSEVTESINQSVRSVIGSLRETIWAISDANISVQDFSDKLKVFTRNLFQHTNVKIHFTESVNSERELNALLGLNLYRICQEILNNAFKYANATEVNIDLKNVEEKLTITLSDNGNGFDASQQNKERYGLENIRKRAAEFGIAISLETKEGNGTKYVLIV